MWPATVPTTSTARPSPRPAWAARPPSTRNAGWRSTGTSPGPPALDRRDLVEELAHEAHRLAHVEGLRQETGAGDDQGVIPEDVGVVPAAIDHLQLGPIGAEPLGQLPSVEAAR